MNRTRGFTTRTMLILGLAALAARAAGPNDGGPILTREDGTKRDWTAHVEICLRSPNQRDTNNFYLRPTTVFDLQSARFLFPQIGDGSSHDAHPDRATGWLRVGSRPVDKTLDVVDGIRPSSKALVAECGGVREGDITFSVDTTVTSYEVKLDEAAAKRAAWPKEDWPPDLAEWLKREPLVESDDDAIKAITTEWIGTQPRAKPPYDTAKLITSKVVELYQPSGSIYFAMTRGTRQSVEHTNVHAMISGFQIDGAAEALKSRRGCELNMPCLLVACSRAAGIPSRIVVAADVQQTQKLRNPILHSWAEFALLDEASGRTTWVPVDVIRLRKSGSRTPLLAQPWLYFGTHDELEWFAPLAFSWTPPVAEEVFNNGCPGLWGWNAKPGVPLAAVEFRMTVGAAAKRLEPRKK